MTKTDMANYYAKRAQEYEQIYRKPERQADLRNLEFTVSKAFSGLDLLEIACGTGYWTQFASQSAKSIVATDYNDEVIAIARQKEYGSCPVRFVKSDAYFLDEVEGSFSAALIAFWWSHVPNRRIEGFLKLVHSKLSDGAVVIILDNRYVEGSSTPISKTDDDGNTYQLRRLDDGSSHEVLKNFPTQLQVIERIGLTAEDPLFVSYNYYRLTKYILKRK